MVFEYPHCTVVRVIDGDTIVVDIDLGLHMYRRNEHVRLFGVDCPERNTPEGKVAKARVEELLPVGTAIQLTSEKLDKYGRMLATVEYTVENPGCKETYDLASVLMAEGHVKVIPDPMKQS